MMKHWKKWRGVAVASLLASLLAGCANWLLPVGESKYDCNRKENPSSPYCHSFKAVVESTNGTLPDSRYDQTVGIAELDRLAGIGDTRAAAAISRPTAGVVLPATRGSEGKTDALEGRPVRKGPVVQRVWIKHFVDDDDSLVGDVKVYRELVPSHWDGFPAAGNNAATTANGYPHIVKGATAPMKQVPGAFPAVAAAGTAQVGTPTTNNEFSQPTSVTAESAPAPADESRASMPQ